MQSLTFIIFIVSKKTRNVEVFATLDTYLYFAWVKEKAYSIQKEPIGCKTPTRSQLQIFDQKDRGVCRKSDLWKDHYIVGRLGQSRVLLL